MNTYLRVGVALLAATSLSACATVIRGTKQKFEIVTAPPGADVSLSTGVTCVSPCTLKLKRKYGFTATISMAGYQTVEVQVESKFNGAGAAAGNIIAGGIIGGVVDATNGSLMTLKPNPINVTLVPN
jgi:hypothetical protein